MPLTNKVEQNDDIKRQALSESVEQRKSGILLRDHHLHRTNDDDDDHHHTHDCPGGICYRLQGEGEVNDEYKGQIDEQVRTASMTLLLLASSHLPPPPPPFSS